jgi:hypothetical protein
MMIPAIPKRPMKNLSLLLLISIAALSCTKGTDEPTSTATFTITGVRDADLTTNSTASQSFILSVASSAAAQETVTLYADGLPKGVFADFVPSSGITPFSSRVTFWNDFSGEGGSYPISVVGNGPSGSRSYKMNVKLDYYKGWKFGDSVYTQKLVEKDAGGGTRYPHIKVYGGGAGILTINFGLGKSLPRANKTYKITPFSGVADDIQVTMFDDPVIYSATGAGSPTGTFTFDTLGKFTFKCTGVEMTDGVRKKMLDCSFSE